MDIFAALVFQDWALFILSLTVLGVVAGFMAGLFGVGGGLVLVPGLFFVFQGLGFEAESLMHVCIGTSLALIIPNGLMSARAHWRKGAVDFGLVKTLGAGVLTGVFMGVVLADYLASAALQKVFAGGVLVFAGVMLFDPARLKVLTGVPARPWTGIVGAGIGAVSSLIGIGGGTLSVPFMSLCGVPIHRAIGTAAALGVVIAVPGALGFMFTGLGEDGRPPFSVGYVNILAWALILPGALVSVKAGVWAAHKAPVDVMRRVFSGFLVIVAIKIWIDIF